MTYSSYIDRLKWYYKLPIISEWLNKTELCTEGGLTRARWLFSPYIQANGLPSDRIFLIQERTVNPV